MGFVGQAVRPLYPGPGRDYVCSVGKSSSTLGGQSSKHSVVSDVSSFAALSHVGLQVFGHIHGVRFTHIPEETAQLQAGRLALRQVDGMPFRPMLIVGC